MQINKCIAERRSTRSFDTKPVPREAVEKIVEAGAYAPSAMNEQPCLFTVVSDAEKLKKLNTAVKGFMVQSDIDRIRSRSNDDTFCFYYNAPTLVIVSCGEARYPKEDVACALENMFLQAHELGLGSCWINQLCGAACDVKDVRDILRGFGVPDDHKVYGCAAIGYIKTPTPVKERRSKVVYID